MIDDAARTMLEEINRYLFLLVDKCRTDAALEARNRAQRGVVDLEKELKNGKQDEQT